MTDIEMWFMVIAAVVGAIVAALLGWGESGEYFDARKFASSIGRAIVAGIIVAVTLITVPTEVTPATYLLSFLAGMGVDVSGNRLAGIVLKKG